MAGESPWDLPGSLLVAGLMVIGRGVWGWDGPKETSGEGIGRSEEAEHYVMGYLVMLKSSEFRKQ